jgi:hypothetical protein
MDNKNSAEKCTDCGLHVQALDGVYFTENNKSRFLCSKCYNHEVSRINGFQFEQITFQPLEIEDLDGEKHTFHFRTFIMGRKVFIHAVEIEKQDLSGYQFSVQGDKEKNLLNLFAMLVSRLERELSRKHIEFETGFYSSYKITDEDIVRGYITSYAGQACEGPCLVVDGKKITWEELGRMLQVYEGFHFKLEIFDKDTEK